MDDPSPRRHDPEVVECLLREFEELIAFTIPGELEFHVPVEGLAGAEVIDLHRVVDDQITRDDGVDFGGVAVHAGHGVAHGRQIDHRGDAGEVLEHHPGGHEGDFRARGGGCTAPTGECLDVIFGDRSAPAMAQGVLEQDPDGER